jgi:hypothetical protein
MYIDSLRCVWLVLDAFLSQKSEARNVLIIV